jgi:hypothetical protein
MAQRQFLLKHFKFLNGAAAVITVSSWLTANMQNIG